MPTLVEQEVGTSTVVILDDRPLVRQGIAAALRPLDLHVRETSSDAPEIGDADALVVLLRPHDPTPLEVVAEAKRGTPGLRVLAMCDSAGAADLREAVLAGVDSLLLTSASLDELERAVRATLDGDRVASPDIAMRLASTTREGLQVPASSSLTRRELEVLEQLAEGRTNSEIAERLAVSPRTVKTHVQNLLGKLEVGDRTGAVARAFRLGLIR